jgi:uncharacterized protein
LLINPQQTLAREKEMKTKFDELLDFPTVLNFKVMGIACDELPDLIIAELQKHTPGDYSPKIKPSSKGNYHSVSIAVTVTSKDHIETIYKTLTAIEQVKYVL